MANVLVVGGTGTFGARLVRGLLDTTEFGVVVAGRDRARLDRLVAASGPRATAAVLDVATVTPDALRALGVFAVVDAAGPYQGGSYGLARAAIAAGLHCLDLADARDHVAGFGALDAAARAAGVVALTGASSTPALSNAALDRITADWQRVDRVAVVISPGNRAPRGLAVMRSILSYAGRPVRVFTGGRWQMRPGWGLTVRRDMPGLGRRWQSLSETPDLDIVPARFAVTQEAVFRAGLELPVLHLGLLAASLPVRAGLVRSLTPFARPFRAVAGLFERFGTDRGGMTVEASGLDASGRAAHGMWSLLAEGGDGPSIPTLPALAALRLLAGPGLPPGARACVGVLTLEQIEAEFAGRQITSRIETGGAAPSLYEAVLGPAFAALPQPVRTLHQPGAGSVARGSARVDGPNNLLARLAGLFIRFPRAAEAVPVAVTIVPGENGERWTRDFGGRQFSSILSAGPEPGTVVERFGPLRFTLALQTSPAGVTGMPVLGWRLGPLPLPRRLGPVSIAREYIDELDRFGFDVELRLPFGLGRLVRYRGWLAVPESSRPVSM